MTSMPTTQPTSHPTTGTTTPDDHALKERHRAMWASGDYPTVARDLVPELGARLVQACRITPGDRVLDIAAGSGNASVPAAATGASVVASDLTPELLAAGRTEAAARGLDLDWQVADAEALPFPEQDFDVVMSCIGVMFAPHQQRAADELLRVCRPGGRIGLLSWTPEGFVGQMLAAMRPYVAPPPPGAQPPVRWGDPAQVAALLGDRVTELDCRRRTLAVSTFPGDTDLREFFARHYGPTLAAYRNVSGDAERVAGLDRALDEVAARFRHPDGGMDWEYLLVTARRR